MTQQDRRASSLREIRELGRPLTIYNYNWNSNKDEYGDPIGFEEQTVETFGIYRFGDALFDVDQFKAVDGASGVDKENELNVYIPYNIEVRRPEVEIDDDDQIEGETRVRASEIIDETTNREWKVIDISFPRNGTKRVKCTDI